MKAKKNYQGLKNKTRKELQYVLGCVWYPKTTEYVTKQIFKLNSKRNSKSLVAFKRQDLEQFLAPRPNSSTTLEN